MSLLMSLLLLAPVCLCAPSSVPFYVREMKSEMDIGAMNENFRAASGFMKSIEARLTVSEAAAGDVTQAGNNAFTGNNTFASTVTFTSTATFTLNGGTIPAVNTLYANLIPKGMGRFNTNTGAIDPGSVNITSITVLAGYGWRVNFAVPFADTNYVWTQSAVNGANGSYGAWEYQTRFVNSFDGKCFNSDLNGCYCDKISIMVFGKQ